MSVCQRWSRVVAASVMLAIAAASSLSSAQAPAAQPNVLLIVTDDQGYGDLGLHGNPRLATPNLDRLGRQSVRFESFYASPVCSPTRASLLTGRYNYRTGVVDTYLGRSLMHADETTLAEMLSGAGYRTGIFGKWHLGDNVPLRAIDQGFGEALTLNGGGIGQPSDPPGGESYFDPLLRRNGDWIRAKGYISDVLAGAAIDFIRGNRDRPFFAYLAFNAPHTPLQAPADTSAKYRAMNLAASDFPHAGHSIGGKLDPETTARVYGMVENIDHNVGRVLTALDDLKVADRTLVIFMTDNGPQQPRYNAGMLRLKGTVNEGGIRVPFFVRLPGRFQGARTIDRIAAHIDVTPTVLEICRVSPPARVRFDGRSLVPLLADTSAAWPDRTLVFQWHRGEAPERGRAFAVRSQRYKLVQWQGAGANAPVPPAPLQLFDMEADPFEQRDLADKQPEIVSTLQRAYDAWFTDVTAERDYSDAGVARIAIGDPRENPVRLTRQDWRGPEAGWTPASVGHWLVEVRRGGRYTVTMRFAAVAEAAAAVFELGPVKVQQDVPAGATSVELANVALPTGEGVLSAYLTQGARRLGVLDVVLTRP